MIDVDVLVGKWIREPTRPAARARNGRMLARKAKGVKLRYFAWVRERIGKPEEEIDVPAGIATVADLMDWLSRRGEEYAHAFNNRKVIRAAIDQTHVKPDAAIAGAREIAFFPPMTGG